MNNNNSSNKDIIFEDDIYTGIPTNFNNIKSNKKSKIAVIILILLTFIAIFIIYLTLNYKPNSKYQEQDYEEFYNDYISDESSKKDINNENNTTSISNISFNTNNVTLKIGESFKLIPTIEPNNVANQSLYWSSSNTKIVSVDNNGNIKAIAEGNATITVSSKNNSKKTTCQVTVSKNTIDTEEIKLNKNKISLIINESTTLTATITPTNANNKSINWKSSNPKVATVSNKGKITAIGKGNTIITASTKDGKIKATCEVIVSTIPVKSIKINSAEEIYVDSSSKASLIYTPTNVTDKSINWSSNNKKIATINSNGIITGISEGNVTITATASNGVKATKSIQIRENPKNFEIIWKSLKTNSCSNKGCVQTIQAYSPLVTKNGNTISFTSVSFNGETYFPYSTLSASKMNTSITKGAIVTKQGYTLSNVKVSYK